MQQHRNGRRRNVFSAGPRDVSVGGKLREVFSTRIELSCKKLELPDI
jgi:hypothetical protein